MSTQTTHEYHRDPHSSIHRHAYNHHRHTWTHTSSQTSTPTHLVPHFEVPSVIACIKQRVLEVLIQHRRVHFFPIHLHTNTYPYHHSHPPTYTQKEHKGDHLCRVDGLGAVHEVARPRQRLHRLSTCIVVVVIDEFAGGPLRRGGHPVVQIANDLHLRGTDRQTEVHG